MQKLIIKGKKKLSGSITISGSKNATLPILAASILTNKKIILKRPIKSEKLCNNINYQIKGKSTRFDIYI